MRTPIYSAIPESDSLLLEQDFDYNEHGVRFIIPKGFQWDGASIPRAFWITTGSNYNPDFILAGLIHDWMYHTGTYTKNKADKVFLRALEDAGVGWYTRNKMYYAVKFFGGKAWDEHRNKEKK